jgi:hypothetical protein
MNAPRLWPLGSLLHRELDDLPLLELRERHVEHFGTVKKHMAAVFALDEAKAPVFE